MAKEHHYETKTVWTGNTGTGTSDYKSYERAYTLSAANKQHEIQGSSDPAFRGDKTRYNPEDLLLASVSSCHMLWYLHLCAVNNVVVLDYVDNAKGIMTETENGSGKFTEITLYPVVTVQDASMIEKANALHHEANDNCFVANSCNFPIKHQSQAVVKK